MPWPELYAITDRARIGGDLAGAAARAFGAGLGWLQVRERDLAEGVLLELLRAVMGAAAPSGARVLVNDRADLAAAAGCHGVHLAEAGLPVAEVRRRYPGLLIGASVHSLDRARQAAAQGADFLLFGHVFATPAKPDAPRGLDSLRELAAAVACPVLAVGGVTPANAADCLGAGAAGVAAIRGIWAGDPAIAVREYLAALRAGRG